MLRSRIIVVMAAAMLAPLACSAPQKPLDRSKLIWDSTQGQLNMQVDAWFDKGEFPKVIQLLRMQNQFSPEDYEIATNLGWMLENVEQYTEALAVYIRFRKQNPQDPDSAFPEANFYFMRKAYAKVPQIIEPTLVKNPHPNSYRTLAHSYDRMKLYHDAKRIWELMVKRFPNDLSAKANLAKVQAKIQPAKK